MDQIKGLAERGVVGTEVVDAAHQIDGGFHFLHPPGQVACASHQQGQPGAEGGIQTLDVGGVQHPPPLAEGQECLGQPLATLHQNPFHPHYREMQSSLWNITTKPNSNINHHYLEIDVQKGRTL